MKDTRLLACDTDNVKSRTLLERTWEVFGFGTHYAWLFCVVFGTVIYDGVSSSSAPLWAHLMLMVGLSTAYALMFCLRSTSVMELAQRGPFIRGTGAVEALATALLIFAMFNDYIGVMATAAFVAAVAHAFIMLVGNIVWARIRSERMMVHLTMGAIMAGILYFAVGLLPAPLRWAIVCALPFAGTLILSNTRKGMQRPSSFRRIDPTRGEAPKRLLIFVICFGVIWGSSLGALYGMGMAGRLLCETRVAMIGAVAAALVSFLIAMRSSPANMLARFGRIGTFALMAGSVLALALPLEALPVACAFSMAGFVLLDLFMWYLNADLVSRSGRSPLDVLARSCAIEWFAVLLGYACGGWAVQWSAATGEIFLPALFAGSALLLACAQSFVFTPIQEMQLIDVQGSHRQESLENACWAIAEEHALSARETEVLVFLANGRSVPYIQEKLTLSQSTVKTHVRNIYRKLQVDGKQSLIDLVESVSNKRTILR